MSQKTQHDTLAKRRGAYARAGPVYQRPLLDQAVGLLGSRRKAAIRALHAGPPPPQRRVTLAIRAQRSALLTCADGVCILIIPTRKCAAKRVETCEALGARVAELADALDSGSSE